MTRPYLWQDNPLLCEPFYFVSQLSLSVFSSSSQSKALIGKRWRGLIQDGYQRYTASAGSFIDLLRESDVLIHERKKDCCKNCYKENCYKNRYPMTILTIDSCQTRGQNTENYKVMVSGRRLHVEGVCP